MSVICLPKIIAHRGASAFAPENTLAALRKAHDMGARWVEFDVKLTRDHQAVVFHDAKLERTTNGTGRMARTPYALLETLDAGSWFSEAFSEEKVPSFAKWMQLAAELGMGVNIEMKDDGVSAKLLAQHVVAGIACYWNAELPTPIVSSFSKKCLHELYLRAPEIPLGFLTEYWKSNTLNTMEKLHCVSLHIDHMQITPERVAKAKERNHIVIAYTVNEKRRAEQLMAMGVDSIITNNPALME